MEKLPIRFTTFAHPTSVQPTTHSGEKAFLDLFRLVVCEDKLGVGLYCACEYLLGKTRKKANVLHVTCGVIDVDSASESAVRDVVAELDDLNLHYIFHSTHSHKVGLSEGKFKCRIVLFLDRPCSLSDWPNVWAAINVHLIAGLADTSCRDPSRMYFLPSCPPGAEDVAFVKHVNVGGECLRVSDLLELAESLPALCDEQRNIGIPVPDEDLLKRILKEDRMLALKYGLAAYPAAISGQHGDVCTLRAAMLIGDYGVDDVSGWPLLCEYNLRCSPPWEESELREKMANARKYRTYSVGWRLVSSVDGDTVSAEQLKKFAKKMSDKLGRDGANGRMLSRILSGSGVLEDASQVFESMARIVASRFPFADAAVMANHMAAAVKATEKLGDSTVTEEYIAKTILTAQHDIHSKKDLDRLTSQALDLRKIKDAFRTIGVDRETPYTFSEIATFAADAGVAANEFKSRWIIKHHNQTFFFIGGEYTRGYSDHEARMMAIEALKPTKLPMFKDGASGPSPMKMSEIAERYGSVANCVVSDMSKSTSQYSGDTKTLVLAPCPMRDLIPAYSEHVDGWLRSLCPSEELQGLLLDWCACVTLLDKPCAAVFLYGEPGTGKSLFGYACARLWRADDIGPTELEDVTGDFNELLASCPLVLGDEFVPTDRITGEPKTDLLRRIVQERSRSYKVKHVSTSKLLGAIRLVLTANNPDILVSDRKHLTNQDIAAITERFLCIKVGDKSKKFLSSLRGVLNKEEYYEFFSGDTIPRHLLWLRDNREVAYGPRFLVEGLPGSELEMAMMVGSGLRSEVCHWLSRYILSDKQTRAIKTANTSSKPEVIRTEGGNALLVTAQALYDLWIIFNPESNKPTIGSLEKALGGVCGTGRIKHNGNRYRVVNLTRVGYWATNNGVCSEEQFSSALEVLGLSYTQAK